MHLALRRRVSSQRTEACTSPARLLIVDPEPKARAALREALQGDRSELWFAGSCAEARALCQRTPGPDVAVVTLELPDGCGLELIEELCDLANPSQCVAITARPTVENAARAMRCGAVDYLIKPFTDLRAISGSVEWALARARMSAQPPLDEQHFEETDDRFALAREAAMDGLWDWDLITNHLQLSRRSKRLLEYEEGDIGTSPDEWFSRVHPEDLSKLKSIIAAQIGGGSERFELDYRMQSKSGNYLWVRTRGISRRDAGGRTTRMAGTHSDISHRKTVEDRLVYEALRDGLTRLLNRVAFHQHLLEAFERRNSADAASFAVLFVDLDRFKNVNDSLGHQAGDQLLLEIARRLQSSIRESDVLARLGGDEFAILVSGVKDMQGVTPIIRRIVNGLRAPCTIFGHELVPSASIGVAFGTSDCHTPEEILRNADIAMYKAKARGRARTEVFDSGMHATALDNFRLEEDLRSAIAANEIDVHYQPIVDLRSRTLRGFEALARWRHAERGWISPEQFIAVAEESDLIFPLGEQVLRAACEQLAIWHQMVEAPLYVSVNLSPKQVFDPGIVTTIAQALELYPVQPDRLKLELTEGVFVNNLETATVILNQLKTLGVKLFLDDFGTGYSSLSYLNHLPFDALKIDRSFVVDLAHGGHSLVKAIASIGTALGIKVVAEGIEEESQLEALCEMGCDFGQGYLFSRPVSKTEAASLVKRTDATSRDVAQHSVH